MVGWLHPVTTLASPALIVPVVAALPGRPHLVASPREVERIFDVALAELADPAIFHEERWRVPGRIIPGSPDNSFAVRFFEVVGRADLGRHRPHALGADHHRRDRARTGSEQPN